ncbi:MAG: SulP family inorganic anion transporter [Kangiellaceae bacterium]|jgi:SulP family sulfate permease|nr:SulP family inorganic anion transporter [Kangiellaceae bacterium]
MINSISLSNFKGDMFGGLSAAIVSMPLALAFGVASGAGAAAGVYGALFVGLFAALFGGTKTLISEPTGPMTVVFTVVVSDLIAAYPEQGLAMAFTVVMMAGVVQITLSTLKLGRYITMIPYSVISGFMSGIGCILILLQIAPLLGTTSPEPGVIGTIANLSVILSQISYPEITIATISLAILFFTPDRIKKSVPPQLIALIFVSVLSTLLYGANDISRIGDINIGLPSLVAPTFTDEMLRKMLIDAMILGTLGCIDSMLTSLIADNLTKDDHDSDRELRGQGIGNLMSGLFGGLPGAGATMGTVVNIQAGGQTITSGVIRVVVLFIACFLLADLLAHIPSALLAAIALKVGVDILDWSFIKRAKNASLNTSLIMYLVLLLTVFVDLILAVGIGLFIANIVTIERLSYAQRRGIKTITDTDEELRLSDDEKQVFSRLKDELLMVYLSGPMMFGLSRALSKQHRIISRYKYVVMDLSDVSFIDDTIALTIENAIADAIDAKVTLLLVRPTGEVGEKLTKLGVIDLLPNEQIFEQRNGAFKWLDARLQHSTISG